MSVAAAYQSLVDAGSVRFDPAQLHAAARMDAFLAAWRGAPDKKRGGVFGFLKARDAAPVVPGLYLYGGVGRGKTMLMDLLVRAAASPRARRVHFHAFMLEVHGRLRALRDAPDAAAEDFLGAVAAGIAADTSLLCFDELHVNDIADAMILGPLFRALFGCGVAVVATSNYAPDELYRDGLQRARFLPFIAFLKARMEVVHLDSPTDYRLRALSEAGTWFYPLGDQSWARMSDLFDTLTDRQARSGVVLDVDGGRTLPIARADAHRAWVEFDTLCREPRGAADYLVLGRAYRSVFIDNVPRMAEEDRNTLRRFMILVDTLYDLGCVLVVRAAAAPDALYSGDSHGFEFQRTLSRLIEMQSPEWWARRE